MHASDTFSSWAIFPGEVFNLDVARGAFEFLHTVELFDSRTYRCVIDSVPACNPQKHHCSCCHGVSTLVSVLVDQLQDLSLDDYKLYLVVRPTERPENILLFYI